MVFCYPLDVTEEILMKTFADQEDSDSTDDSRYDAIMCGVYWVTRVAGLVIATVLWYVAER